MKKKIITRGFGTYPTPLSQRSGCKVGWLTFATEDEAKAASKVAMAEADVRADQGYDFGYCSPGSIEKVADGYEVCIP